jgi:hypothetical protein
MIEASHKKMLLANRHRLFRRGLEEMLCLQPVKS